MTEVKAAAGADMPGELGAEMIGFVNELKSFRADIQKRLQAQEDRMTMLDRKTISRGRAPLSAEADAGAPHQKAFDAYIRHGDDDAQPAFAGGIARQKAALGADGLATGPGAKQGGPTDHAATPETRPSRR